MDYDFELDGYKVNISNINRVKKRKSLRKFDKQKLQRQKVNTLHDKRLESKKIQELCQTEIES